MWIVRLALRRPYTFVVAAMLVAILGVYTILNTPTDIFPDINIPVISVIFNYTGMSPDDMEKRIITPYERILTTTVNQIEHIESQSLFGIGVVKIYFHQEVSIPEATAQVTAVSQTAIRIMPPGIDPPLVIQYSASDVPILQLSIGSDTLPEQELFDQAVNFLRPQLVTVNGVQIPYPYGGKQRQIMVDLDPEKLYSYGISANQVSVALNEQNLILPSGTSKIGTQEYQVLLNSSPKVATQLNELPIQTVNGTPVYIKDVAHVRDGFTVQTNVVHVNGKRGVLLSILKSAGASTLSVAAAIRDVLPTAIQRLDKGVKIVPMFDQSVFVRASVVGVIREAAIAAGLTALMILLFLGSWRSTIIVMISIPLSILVSIIILSAMGETLNTMTLGGMALAVGILVDDATVEIENIHRNLHQRKRLVQAILDGASQIAVPAFVSTLCICIVFVPVVFISGAAKYLFTPLAMAVVFAMLTSYLLSRTLIPTMVHYLLAQEVEMYGGVLDPDDPHAQKKQVDAATHKRHLHWLELAAILTAAVLAATIGALASPLGERFPAVHGKIVAVGKWFADNPITVAEIVLATAATVILVWLIVRSIHAAFEHVFEKLRRVYGGFLEWSLGHPRSIVTGFVLLVGVTCLLLAPQVGTDFFPQVDAGLIRLHVRCPPGTRIEQTEHDFAQVEQAMEQTIPKKEIVNIIDNMGIPNSSINLSLSDGSVMSAADGEILIALADGHHPTDSYLHTLRKELPKAFPDLQFFFAPADIVTQVLNFGLQAPIDIQIVGPLNNEDKNYDLAQHLRQEVASLPGVVDTHFQQVPRTPDLRVNVDRTLADEVGVTQQKVADDLLTSLSSSNQTAPAFWVNPQNGVSYSIFVQTPQYSADSISDLDNTPVSPDLVSGTTSNTQLLSNLASTAPGVSPTNITHYNILPSTDVLMNVQGKDLGSTASEIERVVAKYRKLLPIGSTIVLRGQVQSMHDSFTGLGYGLIFAVVLVYLLMVINFQSWIDPLIILMALPGALAGILWMLWACDTTISVPALMGAIMSIGVATSNSILMITFANDQRVHGMDSVQAALAAGLTRLRPVIMTALAMILGMLPMSLGLGEGGEENAPLARAVIGGLSMATFATLIFVPVVYSLLRGKPPQTHVEPELR
jgi:multidrug efflux pump subunit AcrB